MDVKNVRSPFLAPELPKMNLMLTVNEVTYNLHVPPGSRLVDILREHLNLTGTKISCEIGRCGACAVHMNKKLVNSCLVMSYQANQTSIFTIEGLGKTAMDPIQTAFLEEGGFQCGYCTPGMIMAVKALLDVNPTPTQEEIKEALSGNLCRCTGYGGIIRAVQNVITKLNKTILIEVINQMSKEQFIDTVGWVFEHSPWIAAKAWEQQPFQSKEDLLQTMIAIVKNADKVSQLALIRAHPDLGTSLKISEISQKEQAGAGLDTLSKSEYSEFQSLNTKYVKTFGFPFIIAVKGQRKESILGAMKERLNYTYEQESATALHEVYKIADFRLSDVIR